MPYSIRRTIRRTRKKLRKITIFKNRRIRVIGRSPILTVRGICWLVNSSVPSEYRNIKNHCVIDTVLFDRLENKDRLISKIKERENFSLGRYTELFVDSRRFRTRYMTSSVMNQTPEELIQLFVQWLYVFSPVGYNYDDFFEYELYNRTMKEAKEFMSYRYQRRMTRICRTERSYIKYIRKKPLFNKTFHNHVKRDYLDTTTCSLDEFKAFTAKHPRFFAKPIGGLRGQGASIMELTGSAKRLLKKCRKQKLIVEEIVKQHSDLAEFNQDTVNTIRIYSLLTVEGDPLITLASIKFGRKGACIDNFEGGGMFAALDVETGVITSDAVTRVHTRHAKHPDSHKTFKGFQVPCWDKVTKAVKESALQIPQIRHIGWDVSVTEDGEVEFIEGNSSPAFDLVQAADQVGKKHVYKKHIKKLAKIRREQRRERRIKKLEPA